MKTPRWAAFLLVLALAILFASLEATGRWLRGTLGGDPLTWAMAARITFPVWLSFILAVPFPAWMARRFPIDSRTWPARVPIHLAAGAVFCVVHLTLTTFAHRLVLDPIDRPLLEILVWQSAQYIAVEVFIYWGIAGSFMLIQRERELRAREVAAARLASSLRQATLDALRARLQPHFLYNTLNAISVLAMKGESERVSRAIGHLGGLLRSTLDEDLPQRIPLARELDLLDRYLEIQRLRFPDRLSVERRIAPDTLEAMVPCFVLQPLVENAIQHGLGETGGWVRIAAARAGDALEIEVTDSGPGFLAASPAGGIGLANTRARLAELHGAGGELTCGTGPQGGGRVLLRIPFERAPASPDTRAAG